MRQVKARHRARMEELAEAYAAEGGKLPGIMACMEPKKIAGLMAYPMAILRRDPARNGAPPVTTVLCRIENHGDNYYLLEANREVFLMGTPEEEGEEPS